MNIPTRSEKFHNAPPAPAWIDPNTFGSRRLIRVSARQTHTIYDGAQGIADFLVRNWPRLPAKFSAYIVQSRLPAPGVYVYSAQQFVFAAQALARALASGNIDRHYRSLQELCLTKPERAFFELLDREPLPPLAPFLLPQYNLPAIIAQYFDLHEYSGSELVSAGAKPERAAAIFLEGGFHGAWIPEMLEVGGGTTMAASASPPPDEIGTALPASAPAPRRSAPPGPRGAQKAAFARRETPQTRTIKRTPHMQLTIGEAVAPGETFEVSVYADKGAADPGSLTTPIKALVPKDTKELRFGVWMIASRQFEIIGQDVGEVTLDVSADRTTSAHFTVKADASASGEGRLQAVFELNGRPCGSVSRKISFRAPNNPAPAPPSPPKAIIDADPHAQMADLVVTILNPSGDGRTFNCRVLSRHLPAYANGHNTVWTLPSSAKDIVDAHFAQFTSSDTQSPAARIANLRGAGIKLFDGAPEDFRTAYWALLDAKAPLKSISIITDEPYLPWELMVPRRYVDGKSVVADHALGVTYNLGRWISPVALSGRSKIPLEDSWVFAPRYPDPAMRNWPEPLAYAAAEAKLVTESFRGDEISPAVFDRLESALRTGSRSLLHFTCHGTSPGPAGQSLACQDNQPLYAAMIEGSVVVSAACGAKAPFIFLNACEVGRATPALLGTGGFAAAFIGVGANAVIAPLWSVDDALAHDVAREFYAATLKDPKRPFACILRELRARSYEKQAEDTFAAYCFYGDPLAARE